MNYNLEYNNLSVPISHFFEHLKDIDQHRQHSPSYQLLEQFLDLYPFLDVSV